jgi:YggT family protein
MLTQPLLFLIGVVFGLLVYPLLLRFFMQWLRAPFRNQLGMAVQALTDWLVKPLRRVIPGWRGIDWSTLIAAWLLQWLWLVVDIAVVRDAATALSWLGPLAVQSIVALLKASLYLLMIVLILQAVLSWVAPDGPLSGVLNALTFRFLHPVRRVIPPVGGALDLSPLIVIVVVQLLLMLPIPWLEQAVAQLFR